MRVYRSDPLFDSIINGPIETYSAASHRAHTWIRMHVHVYSINKYIANRNTIPVRARKVTCRSSNELGKCSDRIRKKSINVEDSYSTACSSGTGAIHWIYIFRSQLQWESLNRYSVEWRLWKKNPNFIASSSLHHRWIYWQINMRHFNCLVVSYRRP